MKFRGSKKRQLLFCALVAAMDVLVGVPSANAFFDSSSTVFAAFGSSSTSITNIYIDTTPIADAIRSGDVQISNAITRSSPKYDLTDERMQSLESIYNLREWSEKIGIYVRESEAAKFVGKYGIDVFKAVIEDRIKNFKINEILAADLIRSFTGQVPTHSLREAEKVLSETSNFNSSALMRVVDMNRRQPGKNLTAKDLEGIQILVNGTAKQNTAMVELLSALAHESVREGADFHRVSYASLGHAQNDDLIGSSQEDLFNTANTWGTNLKYLSVDSDKLSKHLISREGYCKNGLPVEIKQYQNMASELCERYGCTRGDFHFIKDKIDEALNKGPLKDKLLAAGEGYWIIDRDAEQIINKFKAQCQNLDTQTKRKLAQDLVPVIDAMRSQMNPTLSVGALTLAAPR